MELGEGGGGAGVSEPVDVSGGSGVSCGLMMRTPMRSGGGRMDLEGGVDG